jgi:hypothetical protein
MTKSMRITISGNTLDKLHKFVTSPFQNPNAVISALIDFAERMLIENKELKDKLSKCQKDKKVVAKVEQTKKPKSQKGKKPKGKK